MKGTKTKAIDWSILDDFGQKHMDAKNYDLQTFALMILTGIRTGLRFSDLSKLTVENIKECENGYRLKGIAKKTKKVFEIPLKAWLVNRLKVHAKGVHLFSKGGKMVNAMWFHRNMQKHFEHEAKQAKKEGRAIGAHSMRKAAALKMYAGNKDMNKVRSFLQHRDLATTSDYMEIDRQTLMDAISDAFD